MEQSTANTSNQASTGAPSVVLKNPQHFEKEMQAYGLKDKIQEISHMNNYIEENVYYKASPELSVSARCHSRTVSQNEVIVQIQERQLPPETK